MQQTHAYISSRYVVDLWTWAVSVKQHRFHMLMCPWIRSKVWKQCDFIFYICTQQTIGWMHINCNEKSLWFILRSKWIMISMPPNTMSIPCFFLIMWFTAMNLRNMIYVKHLLDWERPLTKLYSWLRSRSGVFKGVWLCGPHRGARGSTENLREFLREIWVQNVFLGWPNSPC